MSLIHGPDKTGPCEFMEMGIIEILVLIGT
jgi:hypothetical protein